MPVFATVLKIVITGDDDFTSGQRARSDCATLGRLPADMAATTHPAVRLAHRRCRGVTFGNHYLYGGSGGNGERHKRAFHRAAGQYAFHRRGDKLRTGHGSGVGGERR